MAEKKRRLLTDTHEYEHTQLRDDGWLYGSAYLGFSSRRRMILFTGPEVDSIWPERSEVLRVFARATTKSRDKRPESDSRGNEGHRMAWKRTVTQEFINILERKTFEKFFFLPKSIYLS